MPQNPIPIDRMKKLIESFEGDPPSPNPLLTHSGNGKTTGIEAEIAEIKEKLDQIIRMLTLIFGDNVLINGRFVSFKSPVPGSKEVPCER